ncbi:MAG TPA: hypothetical protein VMI54_05290 [Polyangiaceae bacterium]|nr:hypothetical protein [Polyangiaceae bacterium]
MACEIISVEGAVFALWGKPTKTDLDRVIDRVELISSASGKPIVYITRVPVNAPPPEGDVRAHLNSLMPRFIKACSSYHVVLEGTGFVSAVKRAILASLLQLGWRNGSFFVHESDKGIISKVERPVRPDVEAILALAQKRGLLTAPPPEEGPGLRGSARPVQRVFGHPPH